MLFVDDMQLYGAFDPKHLKSAVSKMESYIQEVRQWISNNSLKLKDGKNRGNCFPEQV